MSRGLYLAAFAVGAMAGSVVTWCFVKKEYERIAQEEINSVKEVFFRKEEHTGAKNASEIGQEVTRDLNNGIARMAAEQAKEKPDLVQYAAMVQKYGGTVEGEKEAPMKEKFPYVISPEEFGEFEEYERISLTYYADGVLVDDNNEVVDDVEDIVGDALDHFGEYEDDSVFVRCDERKCDYEILLDERSFLVDIEHSGPKKVEV